MKIATFLSTLTLASSLLASSALAAPDSDRMHGVNKRHNTHDVVSSDRFLKSKRQQNQAAKAPTKVQRRSVEGKKRLDANMEKRTEHLQMAEMSGSMAAAGAMGAEMASSGSSAGAMASGSMSAGAAASPPPPAGSASAPPAEAASSGSMAAPSETSSVAAPSPSGMPMAAAGAASDTDLVVLNFANTLERLEAEFYTQGLAKFSQSEMEKAGLSKEQAQTVVEELTVIAGTESTHNNVLETVLQSLGQQPNNKCAFSFAAALTDPVTFLATARALEFVGVSAYSGAAMLVENKAILTSAATILSVEARHQTTLNALNAGSAIPAAFDMALQPQQVLSLAGGFLTGCVASDLGVTANEPLSIRNKNTMSTTFKPGDTLQFTSSFDQAAAGANVHCAMLVGGAAETINLPIDQCVVPDGVDGPVYVFLTSTEVPLAADITTQDEQGVLAGPGLIFVDSSKTLLQEAFTIGAKGNMRKDRQVWYQKHKRAGNALSYASADLGYVGVCTKTGKVQGDGAEWYAKNPMLIEQTEGVNANVMGWE